MPKWLLIVKLAAPCYKGRLHMSGPLSELQNHLLFYYCSSLFHHCVALCCVVSEYWSDVCIAYAVYLAQNYKRSKNCWEIQNSVEVLKKYPGLSGLSRPLMLRMGTIDTRWEYRRSFHTHTTPNNFCLSCSLRWTQATGGLPSLCVSDWFPLEPPHSWI